MNRYMNDAQRRDVIRRHDRLVKPEYRLNGGDCHFLFGDTIESDMDNHGRHEVKLPAKETLGGKPESFFVTIVDTQDTPPA